MFDIHKIHINLNYFSDQDVSDLEKAAMLVSAKDKENQEIIEGLRARENEYKRKLSIAETNEGINKERITALTNEMYRMAQNVSESMVDKSELEALEHKLRSEMTSTKDYNKMVESFESFQANIDNEYVSNTEYAIVQDELERAGVDIRVLNESTNVLMREKEQLQSENGVLKDKLNAYILRCEKCENELVELRLKVHDYDKEMNSAKIVMGGIRNIIEPSETSTMAISSDNLSGLEETVTTGNSKAKDCGKPSEVDTKAMPILLQLSKVKLQLRHEQDGKRSVQSQLQKLHLELENLRLSHQESSRIKDMEFENKMLEKDKEIIEKESEVMEWKTSCHELEIKVGELDSKVNALNDKITRLKQEKEQMEKENVKLAVAKEQSDKDKGKGSSDDSKLGTLRKNILKKKSTEKDSDEIYMDEVLYVYSMKVFEMHLSRKDLLVVVYFSGSWVLPCKKIKESGVYDKLCRQFTEVLFLEVEEDSKPDGHQICNMEKVKAMPTVHFYYNKRLIYHLDGFDEIELGKKLKAHLGHIEKRRRTRGRS